MNRPRLPSELHPDYPKMKRLPDVADGVPTYKMPSPAEYIAFFEAHPEFRNEGEYELQCPYCGKCLSIDFNVCCGEAGHGEWVLVEKGEA